MQCGSCTEEIPSDSIFCPECGSRQELSRAGEIPGVGGVGLAGQAVSGGRNFGIVSGEAVINQNAAQGLPVQGVPTALAPDMMGQIVSGMQGGIPPLPGQQPPAGVPQDPNQLGNQMSNVATENPGGITYTQNPALSPTDAMVNRIAEAERHVKNERRSQWLQMNQESAASVLTSIGGELPSHLKEAGNESNAAEFLASAIGTNTADSGNEALYRRMSEVAVRRVARKRGVAVETPQTKVDSGMLIVNVTYVDDGRVLDSPEDLSAAFEHAISTEVALKGMDVTVEIVLFRSKDGEVEKVLGGSSTPSVEAPSESDEEMFACEICDGLVKDSDNECPHCGAVFEDEDDPAPSGGGPPSRGGPPGPGGPPKRGGPSGPSGGPSGPGGGGPPKRGGPSGGPSGPSGPGGGGPPKRSGPPGGPSGDSGGGPPKRGGPPGPSGGGPPKRGGPPGSPSVDFGGGGPPKRGGPPGPKRGGPPGPKRGPPS